MKDADLSPAEPIDVVAGPCASTGDPVPAELPGKRDEPDELTPEQRGVYSPLVLKGQTLHAHDGVGYIVERIQRKPVLVAVGGRRGGKVDRLTGKARPMELRHAHSMTLRRAVPQVRRDRQARKEQKRLRLRQRLAAAAAGQLQPGEKFVDVDWQVDPPELVGQAVR